MAGRRLFPLPETPLNNGELPDRSRSASSCPASTDRVLLAAINGLSRQLTVLHRELHQRMDEKAQADAVIQASVDERLTALGSNLPSGLEPKRKRRAQCPRLAETVRRLHNSDTNSRRYDPEQCVSSRLNEAVTSHLVDSLAESPAWRYIGPDVISSACKTYYATIRRNFCYGQPQHQAMGEARRNAARSRQRRKRLLGARQSVLVPDESDFWRGTTIDMMSDEEDGSYCGLSGWIVRPPSFRSRELSDLCATLQTRLEADPKYGATRHRRLYNGADSDRLPPRSYDPEGAQKHFKPDMRPSNLMPVL